MRETIEDTLAFAMWAAVLSVAEERLGFVTSDADLLGHGKGFTSLTLRDMVLLVEAQLPAETVAAGQAFAAVLEAASQVTGRVIQPDQMTEPILQSLCVLPWVAQGAEQRSMRRAPPASRRGAVRSRRRGPRIERSCSGTIVHTRESRP